MEWSGVTDSQEFIEERIAIMVVDGGLSEDKARELAEERAKEVFGE